jgi:hypothetical protein
LVPSRPVPQIPAGLARLIGDKPLAAVLLNESPAPQLDRFDVILADHLLSIDALPQLVLPNGRVIAANDMAVAIRIGATIDGHDLLGR